MAGGHGDCGRGAKTEKHGTSKAIVHETTPAGCVNIASGKPLIINPCVLRKKDRENTACRRKATLFLRCLPTLPGQACLLVPGNRLGRIEEPMKLDGFPVWLATRIIG